MTAVDLTPIVLLERPYSNATIGQPIHVSGMSNTFEADLAPLPAGTTMTVRLFDRSSENGDPVGVTEALVRLG